MNTNNPQKNAASAILALAIITGGLISALFLPETAAAQTVPFSKQIIDGANVPNVAGRTAIGDINGDGKNDVLLHVWGSNIPNSSEINPDGSLAWYEAPNWTKHIVASGKKFFGNEIQIADIDGDGDNDIVAPMGNYQLGDVVWYENLGGGTSWSSEKTIGNAATDGEIQEMHVLDVDKDGKLDVAVRCPTKIVVFYQNNPASWDKKITSIASREGSVMGDVDADGYPDFIVNGRWLRNPGSSMPGVLPANRSDNWQGFDIDISWADPNLVPPICSSSCDTCSKNCEGWRNASVTVQFADLNNDGAGEIIIAHAEHKNFPITWYKKKNDPKSGASAWEKHEIGIVNFSHTLQAQDFNNDGWVDILSGSTVWNKDIGTDQVVLFVNNGNETFTRQVIASGQDFVYAGRTGDIDNDGDIDFVATTHWAIGGNWSEIHSISELKLWRNNTRTGESKIDSWRYKMIDGNRDKYSQFYAGCVTENCRLKYFGVYADDVNRDGRKDIVSGKYVYLSPENPLGSWTRVVLPEDADGALIADIDGDIFGDVIAFDLPNVYWFEATNAGGTVWIMRKTISDSRFTTGHKNPQSWRLTDIDADGKKEILFEGGESQTGVFALKIPADPLSDWGVYKLTNEGGDGIGVGDIDGNGDPDLAIGPKAFKWYANPGGSAALNSVPWPGYEVGTTNANADRFEVAKIDNDDLLDIVVCEETYPEVEDYPTKCFWYKNPGNPKNVSSWTRRELAMGHGLQSLQILDMDGDGDNDAVIGEHKAEQRMFVYENNGNGSFTGHLVGSFRESHGLYVADINSDNRPDIMHIGWSEYRSLHLWLNRSSGTVNDLPPAAPTGLSAS